MKLNNSNCDETQKLKNCQTQSFQIVIKLKNSNPDKTKKKSSCDKTQIMTQLKL